MVAVKIDDGISKKGKKQYLLSDTAYDLFHCQPIRRLRFQHSTDNIASEMFFLQNNYRGSKI